MHSALSPHLRSGTLPLFCGLAFDQSMVYLICVSVVKPNQLLVEVNLQSPKDILVGGDDFIRDHIQWHYR